jgi:hypothetical protein
MSRVEPKDRPAAPREAQPPKKPRAPLGPTPGKAEGEERPVDEALRRQAEK